MVRRPGPLPRRIDVRTVFAAFSVFTVLYIAFSRVLRAAPGNGAARRFSVSPALRGAASVAGRRLRRPCAIVGVKHPSPFPGWVSWRCFSVSHAVRSAIPQGRSEACFTVSAPWHEAGAVSCFRVSGAEAARARCSVSPFSAFSPFSAVSPALRFSAISHGSAEGRRARRAGGLMRMLVPTIMGPLRTRRRVASTAVMLQQCCNVVARGSLRHRDGLRARE